eukprot:1142576-Pelagomonas_calceolata.AAC.1
MTECTLLKESSVPIPSNFYDHESQISPCDQIKHFIFKGPLGRSLLGTWRWGAGEEEIPGSRNMADNPTL